MKNSPKTARPRARRSRKNLNPDPDSPFPDRADTVSAQECPAFPHAAAERPGIRKPAADAAAWRSRRRNRDGRRLLSVLCRPKNRPPRRNADFQPQEMLSCLRRRYTPVRCAAQRDAVPPRPASAGRLIPCPRRGARLLDFPLAAPSRDAPSRFRSIAQENAAGLAHPRNDVRPCGDALPPRRGLLPCGAHALVRAPAPKPCRIAAGLLGLFFISGGTRPWADRTPGNSGGSCPRGRGRRPGRSIGRAAFFGRASPFQAA